MDFVHDFDLRPFWLKIACGSHMGEIFAPTLDPPYVYEDWGEKPQCVGKGQEREKENLSVQQVHSDVGSVEG